MINTTIRRSGRVLKLAALALPATLILQPASAQAFEGRINATSTHGNQSQALLYTVGTDYLRVELTVTNWPNPVDILDRQAGALTLLFPHNRSFVRLKPVVDNSSAPPGFPQMPGGVPPVAGSQRQPPGAPAMPSSLPPGVGPQARPPAMPAMPNMPNMPAGGGMPAMPAMPMMPAEKMELKATGEKTNLLGYACEKFEIKQRGETMEIWATDQLLPFQNYVRNQTPRFGPRMIEEQWAGLVTAKRLFPLRASLHFEEGAEQYRFEVHSITPQKLTEEDLKLFLPPDGYFEIQPLPF
jgi:hypothetical protein